MRVWRNGRGYVPAEFWDGVEFALPLVRLPHLVTGQQITSVEIGCDDGFVTLTLANGASYCLSVEVGQVIRLERLLANDDPAWTEEP